LQVFVGPGDDLLGGVDVGDARPGLHGRQRSQPGIAEQVEQGGRAFGGVHLLLDPIPLAGLFGEDAQMARGAGLRPKVQALVLHAPARLDLIDHLPVAAHFFGRGLEDGVRGQPVIRGQGGFPHGFRLGAQEAIWAVALQLLAAATIEQLVILPIRGGKDFNLRNGGTFFLCHAKPTHFRSIIREELAVIIP
jgi:hypothetical protein